MNIALIAHDKQKDTMIKLVKEFHSTLEHHTLIATGTTGQKVIDATALDVRRFKSGPYGGDQEMGARIAQGKVDLVIFLRDPLTPQPHEPDVTALFRLADVYQIPMASNYASARLLLKSLN